MLLLESCLQTSMTYRVAECTVNKLLMMDRRTVRDMQNFMPKYICEISASSWFYYKEICHDALKIGPDVFFLSEMQRDKFKLGSLQSVCAGNLQFRDVYDIFESQHRRIGTLKAMNT